MGFGAGDIVGLIWSHPIASVVVALLFTPPLFPIVVFFSPLLISTALVVLAMISMGSDGDESGATPGGYGHSHYKRDWHEQEETDQVTTFDDEDGPLLNDEDRRLHKRRKGVVVSHDDGWFDKVKSWEETGRAWVDSVLHQEARKPSSDLVFTSAAAETREIRFAQPIPQPQVAPHLKESPSPPPASADSTENVLSLEKQAAIARADDDDQAHGGPVSSSEGNSNDRLASEISVVTGEEKIEQPAHSLRAHSLPDEEKAKSTENRGEDFRPTVKSDESELPAAAATADVVVPEATTIGPKATEQQKDTVVTELSTVPREEVDLSFDRDGAGAAAQESSTSGNRNPGDGGKSAPPPSSAAAAAARESLGEHHRTPSVAVTMSEKLNVPLEDIMSLLAGEEKPSSTGAVPTERAVSHEEEEGWSSSDDEIARAAAKGGEQNQPSEKGN